MESWHYLIEVGQFSQASADLNKIERETFCRFSYWRKEIIRFWDDYKNSFIVDAILKVLGKQHSDLAVLCVVL